MIPQSRMELDKGDSFLEVGLGYSDMASYDRVPFRAKCHETPPPLIEELKQRGSVYGSDEPGTDPTDHGQQATDISASERHQHFS